nr:uncharacterized protein sll1735-like [Lepeophtheirus salmonis]
MNFLPHHHSISEHQQRPTMKSYLSILIIATAIIYSGVEGGSPHCRNDCNIVNVLSSYKEFSGLVASVKAAGLVETLLSQGPFTVFAPTDTVFQSLPLSTLIAVVSDQNVLKELLLRHVIPGEKILAQNIPEGTTTLASAAPGSSITIVKQGGSVKVSTSSGSATVTHPNINADNGVIHVINGLI